MNAEKLKKHTFSQIERFVLWRTYNYKCFLCERALHWEDVSVDHLFPECLLNNPVDFNVIKKAYSLKNDFNLNDFENWVPAHEYCNNKKGSRVFRCSTDFAVKIERVNKLAKVIKNIRKKLLIQSLQDKVLAKMLSNLETRTITAFEMYELIKIVTACYFEFPEIDQREMLNLPNDWKMIDRNEKEKYLIACGKKNISIVPLVTPHRLSKVL